MKHIFALLFVLVILAGCTPVGMAVGAGATAGVASAQEGGLSRAVSDTWIQAQINRKWFEYNVDTFAKLDTTIKEGRVLITGVVQDPKDRVEAVRLAWQVEGVNQVINEIRVAESEGLVGYMKDNWIVTRLRTAITFDKQIQSINYTIDCVQGVVYLMGFGQDEAELNRVIETARTISGVKQVVSYVKLVGEDDLPPITGQENFSGESRAYQASAGPQPVYDEKDDMTGAGTGYETRYQTEGGMSPPPAY